MANIDQYLAEIRSAIYGEEVRGSIINALEAQNNETESNTTAAEQALKDAQEAITNAQTAADTANTAAAGADASGENAVKIAQDAADSATSTASDAADEAVKIATEAAETAQSTADAAAENANTAANAANAAAMTQIASYDITYQASSIGTEPPTGEWIHSIPQVAEGNYLWTRVIIISVSGDETTFYSVGKMGSASGGEGGGNLWYGQCETTGNTTAKTVVCDGFNLDTGVEIVVKFQYTNTASNATMNVNSTGAYPIYYDNSNIATGLLRESGTYFFVFDGSHYAVVGELSGAAIDELQQDVAQINEDLAAYEVYADSVDDLLSASNNLTNRRTYTFMVGPNLMSTILGISTTAYGKGFIGKQDTVLDGLFTRVNSQEIYTFRVTISTGAISNIAVFSGTTLGSTSVTAQLTQLNTSLSDLQTSVSTNTSNISQNASDISDLDEKVEQNTADIEENKTNIEQNASDITEINSALADIVMVKTYTYSLTASANGTGFITVSEPISGYTPLGIVGYRLTNGSSGTNASWCFPYSFCTDSLNATSSFYIAVRNTGSDDASVTLYVSILYVKNV